MKIRKIKIKNYKLFDDLELDFTDVDGNTLDTIVLAGVNGCGKTTILQLLQKRFSQKSNQFKKGKLLYDIKDKDIILCDEIIIEFESSFDAVNEFKKLLSAFKKQTATTRTYVDVEKYFTNINLKLSKSNNKTENIKIFEFLCKNESNGSQVKILKNDFILFSIFQENILKYFSVLYFLASSFELFSNKKNIKEIIEADIRSHETDGITKLVDIFSHKKEIEKYLINSVIDSVLKNREITVKDAIEKKINEINHILKHTSVKTKLVNITSDKAIFNSPNGKEISIDDLSSGEKQLYYRAALLNKLNVKNSLILVDEPETALHPTWQREIIKLYQNAGENNQVILATHSPHIIASVNPKNLFVLYFDDNNKVQIMNMEKAQKNTKGVEPNRILQEIMGFELRDEETQQRIDEIVTLLRVNPESRHNEEFSNKLQSLIRDLGIQDPSIMRIQHQLFLLDRKR